MEKKGNEVEKLWVSELKIVNDQFSDMAHTKNIIQLKTFEFSVKVINTVKELRKEQKEFVLTNQLLKSATSIGANVEESIGGYSNKDFQHKLSIAYKEARETKYWLRLLKSTNYLEYDRAEDLLEDCEEILKILGSIQKTLKTRNS